ncbi:mitotic spindle checkpoint protein Bub3 [Teratosphaeriaceae sp. CCFEE 6253]|nr:mitotic spindle checkpoint protein Bub3 [Teratosphaeriaceae sp. CCFEE 6253]
MSGTQYDLDSPPTDAISALRFSPSGRTLAVSSWDRTISLYRSVPESTGDAPPFTFSGTRIRCRAPVLDVCWGADDETLFAVGLDWDVRQIRVGAKPQTGNESGTEDSDMNGQSESDEDQIVLSTHGAASNKLAFSDPHGLLISTSWDSTLHIHLPATHKILRVPLPAKPFALSLTSTKAVVAMADRHIAVHDLNALRLLTEQAGTSANGVGPNHDVTVVTPWQTRESSLKFMTRAVACMPDGTGFATSSIEGRVGVDFFDPAQQGGAYAFKCHRQTVQAPSAASGGAEQQGEGEAEVQEVDVVYPVNALAFHPVHGTFATGGGDGVVCVWDAKTKRRVRQFPKFAGSVAGVEFSGDGQFMAVGVSPGFEDGEEAGEGEGAEVKVVVRVLGEGEVRGKGAK